MVIPGRIIKLTCNQKRNFLKLRPKCFKNKKVKENKKWVQITSTHIPFETCFILKKLKQLLKKGNINLKDKKGEWSNQPNANQEKRFLITRNISQEESILISSPKWRKSSTMITDQIHNLEFRRKISILVIF
jgi:hypothetical protein